MRRRFVLGGLASLFASALAGCAAPPPPTSGKPADAATAIRRRLIQAARNQIGRTVIYDPAYATLAFPMGDIPLERGVCSDVIVRAFRDAGGPDLQSRLNADMRANFDAYPTRWGLAGPDPNIDHRRVLNLQTFFARAGAKAPLPADASGFEPGDIVTWMISNAEPHIGIVSDRRDAASGRLMVIHNFSKGAIEEDFLWAPGVSGRYRPEALFDVSL